MFSLRPLSLATSGSYFRTFLIASFLVVSVLGMQACGGGTADSADSHQYPRVSITTTALPDATVGTAYAFTMKASGGSGADYLWVIRSGTLPDGLKFDLNGNFSGTPTAAGTFQLTFNVQHTCYCVSQNQPQSATATLNLIVH